MWVHRCTVHWAVEMLWAASKRCKIQWILTPKLQRITVLLVTLPPLHLSGWRDTEIPDRQAQHVAFFTMKHKGQRQYIRTEIKPSIHTPPQLLLNFPVCFGMLSDLVLQADCTNLFYVHSVLFICCFSIHWWCYATILIHCIAALSCWSTF